MLKLSEILIPLYQSACLQCACMPVNLNLDLSDPTITVDADSETLQQTLQKHLNSALSRTINGHITIGAHRQPQCIEIFIQDTGQSLTRTQCAELSNDTTKVHSRHGYGTTVTFEYPVFNN